MSHNCRICTHFKHIEENDPRWAAASAEWRSYYASIPRRHIFWCVKRHKICRWYNAFYPMDGCEDYHPDFPANRLPGKEAT